MASDAPRCIVRNRKGTVRCDRPAIVKEHGLCAAHYKRVQRTGKAGSPKIGKWRPLPVYVPPDAVAKPGICAVPDCGAPVLYPRYKLCRPHYERYRVQRRIERRPLEDIDLKPITHRPARPGRRKKGKAAA